MDDGKLAVEEFERNGNAYVLILMFFTSLQCMCSRTTRKRREEEVEESMRGSGVGERRGEKLIV